MSLIIRKTIFTAVCLCLMASVSGVVSAQEEPEEPVPLITLNDKKGEVTELTAGETFTGEAPIRAQLSAGAEQTDSFICVCQWQFTLSGEEEPFLTRYEESTDYTFDKSGIYQIQLTVTYTLKDNPEIIYEYQFERFTVTVSESSLKVPNAFSPNGDGINDYYNVYDVKSIVSFKGAIFNRWGQKLYSWGLDEIDCEDCGWDGTYNGSPVKDGVYFAVIEAKGADGVVYTFKKDVNILRGFTEKQNSSNP